MFSFHGSVERLRKIIAFQALVSARPDEENHLKLNNRKALGDCAAEFWI
jgi:hypothetical protein